MNTSLIHLIPVLVIVLQYDSCRIDINHLTNLLGINTIKPLYHLKSSGKA